MKFALIAMSVCFLYIICNFEIFLTVNSSMASKMATEMEILFIGDILHFVSKNHHTFAIRHFRHHLRCIQVH